MDLISGIKINEEILNSLKNQQSLSRLIGWISGKNAARNRLFNENNNVTQMALLEIISEVVGKLSVSNFALNVTQNQLLEARKAIRGLQDMQNVYQENISSIYDSLDNHILSVKDALIEINEKYKRLTTRVVANEEIEHIFSAWSSGRTYYGLPWVIQVVLIVRDVFCGALGYYELAEGLSRQHRNHLVDKLVEAPHTGYAVSGDWIATLDNTCSVLNPPSEESHLISGLLNVGSETTAAYYNKSGLYTLGVALEVCHFNSSARPRSPGGFAVDLFERRSGHVRRALNPREIVEQIVSETADHVLENISVLKSSNPEN